MQDLQSSDLNNCFVPNGEPLKRCSTLKFNANCEMIFRTWEIQYIKNEEGKKMFSNAVELLNSKKTGSSAINERGATRSPWEEKMSRQHVPSRKAAAVGHS